MSDGVLDGRQFQMLTAHYKSLLLGEIGPLLDRVRATGREEIAAQNAAAIKATGKPRFQDGPLATMASLPRRVQMTPYSADPGMECLAGPDGGLYSFCRGHPTTYIKHRAGWKALPEELDIIRKVTGLGSDEEAHALLPELHNSDFSYGVVALVIRRMMMGLYTPVAIRSEAVGSNQGTLSGLGGFVRPGETLFAAAERQLAAEGSLRARFRGWGAWGPHNVAPSATFVLPADLDESGVGVVAPEDAWEFEGKVFSWVPLGQLANLLVAPVESQDWFLRHFAALGLPRDEICVAPDIIRPTLAVIRGLSLRRGEDGLRLKA